MFDLELMRNEDVEETVGLLQITVACTSATPSQWPEMSDVAHMIEEMLGVGLSVSESPAPP